MVIFDVEQPAGIGVLTFEGSLGIQDNEELKSNFVNALHTVDKVILNVKNIYDIDISCLELFCSAHRTSVKLQKTLSFSDSISGLRKGSGRSGT